MPYAANNKVSKSPIDGGIEITPDQYREALDGMAAGRVVRVDFGFEIVDPPQPVTYWLAADDQRETDPGEEPPAGSQTEPPPSPFHDLVDGEWVEDLAAVEAHCLQRIDNAAAETRARFISTGAGQESTYLAKYDEAVAHEAAASPTDGDYPLLNAEAQRRGVSVADLAAQVISLRGAWIAAAAQIEASRVGGKDDVRAAIDADGKRTARDASLAELEAIQP